MFGHMQDGVDYVFVVSKITTDGKPICEIKKNSLMFQAFLAWWVQIQFDKIEKERLTFDHAGGW